MRPLGNLTPCKQGEKKEQHVYLTNLVFGNAHTDAYYANQVEMIRGKRQAIQAEKQKLGQALQGIFYNTHKFPWTQFIRGAISGKAIFKISGGGCIFLTSKP